MKHQNYIFMPLMALLFAGCTSYAPSRYYPEKTEQTTIAITALYDETRTSGFEDASFQTHLIADSNTVAAAEAMLNYFSKSNNPEIRQSATCRLAHFGTQTALMRAIELGRSEPCVEERARIWGSISELLYKQQILPERQTSPPSNITTNSPEFESLLDYSRALTNPELTVVLSCGYRISVGAILPEEVTIEEIDNAIISQYAEDDGQWSVEAIDRIPFVPFSAKHYTVTNSVRQEIAFTLQRSAYGNTNILEKFKEFSLSDDKAISEPAKDVVKYLKN